MMNRLLTIGKLALDPGTKYSEAGRGFLRMNVAAPFETIKDGVERFKKALAIVNKEKLRELDSREFS